MLSVGIWNSSYIFDFNIFKFIHWEIELQLPLNNQVPFVYYFFILNQEWFLGHGLVDHEPAIIHHFAFHQNLSGFKFPDFDAGWAMSMSLVKRLVKF